MGIRLKLKERRIGGLRVGGLLTIHSKLRVGADYKFWGPTIHSKLRIGGLRVES